MLRCCAMVNKMQIKTDTLGQDFILISRGSFLMGKEGSGASPSEGPVQKVKLERDYWFSTRPVTQSVWSAVMGSNPSKFQQGFEAGLRPVERVSWLEATQFGDKLYEYLGEEGWHTKGTFRLPSESEWEYAARAGTTSDWYCGDADHSIHQHIWNAGNSGAKTNVVGQKEPNPWGLHDICGNVGEWCLDNWHSTHQNLPLDGSPRVGGGDAGRRVHKGGSWFTESEATRCGARASAPVNKCSDGIGLRILWQEL